MYHKKSLKIPKG